MKVQDIEIPYPEDRHGLYRLFEILPGLLSFLIFLIPVILSIYYVTAAAWFVITYVLILLIRASAMSIRVIEGYGKVKKARKINWEDLLLDFYKPDETPTRHAHSNNSMVKDHIRNMQRLQQGNSIDLMPDDVIQVVMICTYNESQAIIHPTIDNVLSTHGFNNRKTALFIAYEERASDQKKHETLETLKLYKNKFFHAEAVEHTLVPGEIPGKGANATNCGRRIAEWAQDKGIDPSKILVTTLDADNRPDKNYFSILTYVYISVPTAERMKKSYQPMALYNNNIWDVPAIMRLCAISNTYFHMANSVRPQALRNFSAHSQSLDALIDMNFWSVRTIVEDGHQFWRAFFRYDGDHEVLPIYAPIYQDAVYAGKRITTTKAQFKQIRRWTYGASDVAYVATLGMKMKKRRLDTFFKFNRLLESHVGWATSAPLILLAGWAPLFINAHANQNIVAQRLPNIVSTINTIALIALLTVVYIGLATLPQRPAHHKKRRIVGFVWQWILTPVVGVLFNSTAAINSQTHLMFRRYIGTFDVTEKAVATDKK